MPKAVVAWVRGRPRPLITLNNALLAVMDPRGIPERAIDPLRFGAWVENACLAHAWNLGQAVRYWREEPLEVDAVLEGSLGSWAIEVSTGTITPASLRGLAEFVQRHPKFHPLGVCEVESLPAIRRLGLEGQSWQSFLLHGPRVNETPSP